MKLALITVVGGRISTLERMLEHYIGMGVDSVLLYAHLESLDEIDRIQLLEIVDRLGIEISGVVIGEWESIQYRTLSQIAVTPPDQWYLIADQDEFHEYPKDIRQILAQCDAGGFHYVRGCFVDRFSSDGCLAPIDPARSLSEQFPMGAFFTKPILGGSPMKIVAARGGVTFTNCGHHAAVNGNAYPAEDCFVPVHHYKWSQGLVQYLNQRSRSRPEASAVKREDRRFRRYLEMHSGRIDLTEPGILAGLCSPSYPYWATVKSICLLREHWQRINFSLTSSTDLFTASEPSK
jgi:hypothetical protein